MEDKEKINEYTKGDVTVVWKPDICIHSANCVNGLPDVFNPKKRPWINPEVRSTKEIINQIDKCPSGALSYYMNNEEKKEVPVSNTTKIQVIPNGPLIVFGPIDLADQNGERLLDKPKTSFCRCGASENKPFCDGTHKKIQFEG